MSAASPVFRNKSGDGSVKSGDGSVIDGVRLMIPHRLRCGTDERSEPGFSGEKQKNDPTATAGPLQTGLEPVTQPFARLSPPPGGSLYRYGKTLPRSVFPATVNSACRRFARRAALHNPAATGACTACGTQNK